MESKKPSIPDLRTREFMRPRRRPAVSIPDGVSFADFDPATAPRSPILCELISDQLRTGVSNPELVGSGDGLFDGDSADIDITSQYGYDRFDRIHAGVDSTALGVMADASSIAPAASESAPASAPAPAPQPSES